MAYSKHEGKTFQLNSAYTQKRLRLRVADVRGVAEVTALGVNASGGQPGAGKDNNGQTLTLSSSFMAVLGL